MPSLLITRGVTFVVQSCFKVDKPFPYFDIGLFTPSWAKCSAEESVPEQDGSGDAVQQLAAAIAATKGKVCCVRHFVFMCMHAVMLLACLQEEKKKRADVISYIASLEAFGLAAAAVEVRPLSCAARSCHK